MLPLGFKGFNSNETLLVISELDEWIFVGVFSLHTYDTVDFYEWGYIEKSFCAIVNIWQRVIFVMVIDLCNNVFVIVTPTLLTNYHRKMSALDLLNGLKVLI